MEGVANRQHNALVNRSQTSQSVLRQLDPRALSYTEEQGAKRCQECAVAYRRYLAQTYGSEIASQHCLMRL